MKWLIYGHNGWIAKQFIKEIPDNINIIKGKERFENFEQIKNEILTIKPDNVVILGGLTYKSPATNIDWCEDNKQEVKEDANSKPKVKEEDKKVPIMAIPPFLNG